MGVVVCKEVEAGEKVKGLRRQVRTAWEMKQSRQARRWKWA